ncbi:unnamed protein product [Allacma fusca]|uniref:Uncharacterized protein n=1 Tax=Allacma fusca TaxID=39272 RepID=A0A8J2PJW7_9HEXA|nr:unnamed protein product [Allacma fusca]
MADMGFDFSTEQVTLWPWQYHDYEPPGSVNHTDLYYCHPTNRCESCKVVSIIRWVHEGDLLGFVHPQLAQEVHDPKYMPTSSCSSKNASQSGSKTSFNSSSSERGRGDNSVLSESRSQPWGNCFSESASVSSILDMETLETDLETFDLGTTTQPVIPVSGQEKYNTRSSSRQCSYSEWYPAHARSYAFSSTSAHTSLSLGMQSNLQQYPTATCQSETHPIEPFVNPFMSDHNLTPIRQVYYPMTAYAPVPWNEYTIPQGAPRAFVNYMTPSKSIDPRMGNNDWSSYRGSYCFSAQQGGMIQNEDTMEEPPYLFHKDYNITNRKSSSAPAGSPALLSPRGYFQWQSHEFPPPCSIISSNAQSTSANCFPLPVSSSCGDNPNSNPENSTKVPNIAFSSAVKSNPPEQCQVLETNPQPIHEINPVQEKIQEKKIRESSTSSKNSNSSNNVSPANSRTGNQGCVKINNQPDVCAENNPPQIVKQRPQISGAAFAEEVVTNDIVITGQPHHMKLNCNSKDVTASPLSTEEKAKSLSTCATIRVAHREDETPSDTAAGRSCGVEKANGKKDKSTNSEISKGCKKGKIRKVKGKKAVPTEKVKELVEAKVIKDVDHQEKFVLDNPNPTSSSNKRKHVSSSNSTPSRVFPSKLRELNPDVRTPRSVRLRALHACRMNLNSTTGDRNSDSDIDSDSTVELSFDDSSLSFEESAEPSGTKNKMKNQDRQEHAVERRRVKKRKQQNAEESVDKEETRDMGCQTSK